MMAELNSGFACLYEKCDACLPDVKKLIRHIRLIHGDEKSAQLYCRINACGKMYSSAESYRKHVVREHHEQLLKTSQINSQCSGTSEQQVQLALCDDQQFQETFTVDEPSVAKLINNLTKNVCMFALNMQEQNLLAKSTCTSIISDISGLLSTYHENFSDLITHYLAECGISVPQSHPLSMLLGNESYVNAVWENVKSDYRLKQYCVHNLEMVESTTIELGRDELTGKVDTCQYVSVRETLRHYLQHEDVWYSINRTKPSVHKVLSSFTDGDAFKQHAYFSKNPSALRLHFYVDDLELCNPLGSAKKKHSVTCVYFQVGNLEQKHLSSLKSIHVACIARAVHTKKYGLSKVLEKLIQDSRELETVGIEVIVDGKCHRVYASMTTLPADNLASHEIGGFRVCFNSGRICRFCMTSYDEISSLFSETDCTYPKLRTALDHQNHVLSVTADDRLCSVYGVKGKSVFSLLESFDVTTALPPDCMHDILERLFPLILKVCLRGLMSIKPQIITVQKINEKLLTFPFGKNDVTNRPPQLSSSFPNTNIAGTASQKWCFFVMLPFLIGNLVPQGNPFWELYLLCRSMADIIFAPAITNEHLSYLDQLISDHHRLLKELAPDDFTPKCHFVTHYPRLIQMYGPLRHVWCMRFEAYHQYLKSVAWTAGNFKNICYTLAERNQMKKCFEQSGSNCLQYDVIFNSIQRKKAVRSFKKSLQKHLTQYFGCSLESEVLTVKSVTIEGVHYAEGDCLILDVIDLDVPVLMHIVNIASYDGIWGIVGNLVACESYLPHFHAYVVNVDLNWLIVRPGNEMYCTATDMYELSIKRISMDAVEEITKLIALPHLVFQHTAY